ncbi:kinase-like protein [Auriscalpium vulgare]|uniref:Kinase-like protein n=1 Tax=Auriscalpium vulgare TaxID=40419 RepID=A0ACB8RW41_9AGAM|nr:kinase-like protein [Auriscalpium vulgare]
MLKVRIESIFKKFSTLRKTQRPRSKSISPPSSLLSLETDRTSSSLLSLPALRTPSNRSAQVHLLSKKELDNLYEVLDACYDPSVLDVRRSLSADPPLSQLSNVKLDNPSALDEFAQSVAARFEFKVIVSPEPERTAPTTIIPLDKLFGPPPPPRIVQADDFSAIRIIGEGATGKVYLVEDTPTATQLALKVIRKREFTTPRILNEKKVLERIAGNEEFISLEASFHDDKNFYLATSYHPMDMQSELRRRGSKVPLSLARHWGAELILAIEKLHKLNVVHRDIKPANILLDQQYHITLADFGMAKLFPLSPSEPAPTGNEVCASTRDLVQHYVELMQGKTTAAIKPHQPYPDGPADHLTHSKLGTAAYTAPEVLIGREYSYGVDFWSFGVVMFILLTGRFPFGPLGEESCGNLTFMRGEVDRDAESLLRSLLNLDPSARPNINQIKSHPFFQSTDWDRVAKRDVGALLVPTCTLPLPSQPKNLVIPTGTPYAAAGAVDPHPEFTFISAEFQKTPRRQAPVNATIADYAIADEKSELTLFARIRKLLSKAITCCARGVKALLAWR